jgi:hypothetical protein
LHIEKSKRSVLTTKQIKKLESLLSKLSDKNNIYARVESARGRKNFRMARGA